MNGLNETIKTKKMPETGETEAVNNTEGAVNAEAAATNRIFVRECVKERGRFSRIFETKNGEKAAVIYPKAVHFQKNGVWTVSYTHLDVYKRQNYSLCRATEDCGKDAHTDGKFNLSQKGCMEIMKLFMTKDEDLYDKTIEDVFDDEVFNSTFWLYWRTMFAFENWHSALEMKLYFPVSYTHLQLNNKEVSVSCLYPSYSEVLFSWSKESNVLTVTMEKEFMARLFCIEIK